MIEVFVGPGCSRCALVTRKLDELEVEYKKINLQELERRNEIIGEARKSGISALPIILKNGKEFITLEEVLAWK